MRRGLKRERGKERKKGGGTETRSVALTFFPLFCQKKKKLFLSLSLIPKVLFAARIHPETRSGQLSQQQVARLARALRSVAETACAARADSSLFPKEWIFHQRWDERAHSATHEGHGIRWIKVGGRTTAFCPGIQKKTDDGGGSGGGEEEKEEEEGQEQEEEEETKPKSKAAASTAASKRKQPPPPKAAAALPPPPKAGKRAKGAVAVPKAPSRAAPSARARALPPRI